MTASVAFSPLSPVGKLLQNLLVPASVTNPLKNPPMLPELAGAWTLMCGSVPYMVASIVSGCP